MRYPLVTYDSDRSTTPRRLDLSWEEVVELTCTHEPTPCTRATCRGRECPHKKCGAWSPVVIDGARANENVRQVTLLVIDVDHFDPERLEWLEAIHASGLRWACASSHQHDEGAPRYRVVLPLSRPLLPSEYRRVRRHWIERHRVPADTRTGDLSRIYYLPTSRADCPPESDWRLDGAAIDVDAELAAAPPEPEPGMPDREGGAADWLDSTAPLTEADDQRLRLILDSLPERGQGKGATYQAYCAVFHDFGLGIADGWPLIVHWNERCGSPHSPEELERQFYRCASRSHERPRGWQRGGDVVAGIVAAITRPPEGSWAAEQQRADRDVGQVLGTGEQRSRRARPLFSALEVLRARELVPVSWHVEGLIKRGGVAILGGRSKIGKSFILKEVAVALATGTSAFGKFPVGVPQRVAYFFAEEYAGDVRAHLEALSRDRGDPGSRLFAEPRGEFIDLLRNEDVADVVASVRALGGADVVVLEPLRDIHSAKESDSDEMKEVMRRLAVIGQLLSCTVITVQHETKPQTGADVRKGGERMRGSSAIYAAADAVISATPVSKTPSRIEVTVQVEVRGARSADEFGLVLDIVDGPGGQAERARFSAVEPRDESAEAAPPDRDLADAVAAEVERHAIATHPLLTRWRGRGCACPPGAVIHARDLGEARGAHRVEGKRDKVRAAVRRLVESGRIERVGGEHGSLKAPESRVRELAAELGAAE